MHTRGKVEHEAQNECMSLDDETGLQTPTSLDSKVCLISKRCIPQLMLPPPSDWP